MGWDYEYRRKEFALGTCCYEKYRRDYDALMSITARILRSKRVYDALPCDSAKICAHERSNSPPRPMYSWADGPVKTIDQMLFSDDPVSSYTVDSE